MNTTEEADLLAAADLLERVGWTRQQFVDAAGRRGIAGALWRVVVDALRRAAKGEAS